jgi:adenine-specific DNA glycosylase
MMYGNKSGRFIKLTGNIYGGYDLPIRVLSIEEWEHIKKEIGGTTTDVIPTINTEQLGQDHRSSNNTNMSWYTVLDSAGIYCKKIPKCDLCPVKSIEKELEIRG